MGGEGWGEGSFFGGGEGSRQGRGVRVKDRVKGGACGTFPRLHNVGRVVWMGEGSSRGRDIAICREIGSDRE